MIDYTKLTAAELESRTQEGFYGDSPGKTKAYPALAELVRRAEGYEVLTKEASSLARRFEEEHAIMLNERDAALDRAEVAEDRYQRLLGFTDTLYNRLANVTAEVDSHYLRDVFKRLDDLRNESEQAKGDENAD